MGQISITSSAVATELCVIEDFPASVRGTTSSNDVRLAELIRRVSVAIPRYLGRHVAQQTYQEDIPGYGDTVLRLMVSPTQSGLYPGGPITTLSTGNVVELDTEDGSSPTTITDWQLHDRMAGQLYRRRGWTWTAQVQSDLTDRVQPASERPLFRATYTAGWTTPRAGTAGTTVEGTLPWDIRQAAIESVTAWFHREQRDTTVTERRLGDVQVRYRDPVAGQPHGLPEAVRSLLSDYRRLD